MVVVVVTWLMYPDNEIFINIHHSANVCRYTDFRHSHTKQDLLTSILTIPTLYPFPCFYFLHCRLVRTFPIVEILLPPTVLQWTNLSTIYPNCYHILSPCSAPKYSDSVSTLLSYSISISGGDIKKLIVACIIILDCHQHQR